MSIQIEGLSKIYPGGNMALQDISVEIKSGMFGLLGPNGAGKTTLMRILVTLMRATLGRVSINGLDLEKNRREIRAMMGYLPQDFSLFSKLKTWEFLDYVARLAGLKQSKSRKNAVDEYLDKVGLFDVRERPANKLSGGMKRRLGIAQALIGGPKIIIVDEPTTGLDPEERIRFRNLLTDLGQKEVIILLSTHIVGDISSSCTEMALLDRGRVAYHGPPESLIDQARGHVFATTVMDSELETIKERYPVISTIPTEKGWEVEIVAERLDHFDGHPIEPNLEHAYVYFMDHILNHQIDATLD